MKPTSSSLSIEEEEEDGEDEFDSLTTTTTTTHQQPLLPTSSSSSSREGREGREEIEEKRPSRTLVFLTVNFYLVAALVMVFVNKWVLNSISIPIFLLWCQLIIAVILLKISNKLKIIKLPKKKFKNLFFNSPNPSPSTTSNNNNNNEQFKLLKSILPLVLINVLGLIFNTFCLKYVDASFYQVARGLILPFTVLASRVFLGIKSTLKVNISTLIVCIGFMVGVNSERFTISFIGVLLGILSSITTALHSIIVKKTYEKINSTTLLTYYSNFLSAIFITPFIFLSGEFPTILNLFFYDYHLVQFKTFFIGTLVTGFFGFLICIAGFLSIKVTSPVTHMISSAVRGVIQTGLGVLLFGDQVTTGRISGIVIILGGSLYYTWVKDQELMMNKKNSTNINSNRNMTVLAMKPLNHNSSQETQNLIVNSSLRHHDHDNEEQEEEEEEEEDQELDEDLREIKRAEKALGI